MSRLTPTRMTFKVIPGSVAGHAGQLVLIEQREGAGKVQLQDLATAARSKVLLAALCGGEIGPHTELYDARIDAAPRRARRQIYTWMADSAQRATDGHRAT